VGTIVSAGYGFICGAYMPISSFSVGLQKVISFLPGTYGTSLLRNHAMGAVLDKMAEDGLPSEVIDSLKDALDCNIYFFENSVSIPVMYVFLGACTAALIAAYVAVNYLRGRKIR
jgi:multidrug/hemolysin transport system permease protein